MKNPKHAARREFLQEAAATALTAVAPYWLGAPGGLKNSIPGYSPDDTSAIRAEIEKRHEESVRRLQNWILQKRVMEMPIFITAEM